MLHALTLSRTFIRHRAEIGRSCSHPTKYTFKIPVLFAVFIFLIIGVDFFSTVSFVLIFSGASSYTWLFWSRLSESCHIKIVEKTFIKLSVGISLTCLHIFILFSTFGFIIYIKIIELMLGFLVRKLIMVWSRKCN